MNQFNCKEELRTEYTALSSYFNTVITFRFTTLGFYLAAIGFIVGGTITREKARLLLGISLALYILELRNRSLFYNLAARGMQIERECWGFTGKRAYEPFYSHMFKEKPSNDPQALEPPLPDYTKIWKWKLRLAVSHTHALDLLYLFIIAFSLYKTIF